MYATHHHQCHHHHHHLIQDEGSGENYGALDGLNSGHGEPAWKQLDAYAQFVKAAMSTFSNYTNLFTCSPQLIHR